MMLGRLFVLFLAAAPMPLSAAVPPSAAPAPPVVSYRVQPRDTLSDLARAYFIGPAAAERVRRLNRIADARRMPVGRVLRIPRALLRDEPIPAMVESFSGPVTLRLGPDAHAARTGERIGEGASIETGRNAFLTLRLADGTALAVPSQSTVRIVRLRKVMLTGALEREIAVGAGRLRAKVTPMTDPNSSFRVTTPIAVSAVRGTDFRVAFEDATHFSATQVDDGAVAFAAASASEVAILPPGFGAAEAGGRATGVVKLLPPPKLLDPDKVQSDEALRFVLAPLAGAVRYHVQVAKDAGFLETISETVDATPELSLASIPSDSYFVRVSAYDGVGLEGTAETYSFERRRNSVSGSADPAPPGERRLRFRWDSVTDGSPRYRFQLVRKGTPDTPVLDEPGLSDTMLSISNLPAGDYSWRVCSLLIVKGRVVATWSVPQSLHVAR